jgi:hypothetical protein
MAAAPLVVQEKLMVGGPSRGPVGGDLCIQATLVQLLSSQTCLRVHPDMLKTQQAAVSGLYPRADGLAHAQMLQLHLPSVPQQLTPHLPAPCSNSSSLTPLDMVVCLCMAAAPLHRGSTGVYQLQKHRHGV